MSCYCNRQRANGEAYSSKEVLMPIIKGMEVKHNPMGKGLEHDEAAEAF